MAIEPELRRVRNGQIRCERTPHHPWYPTRNLSLMVVGSALDKNIRVVCSNGSEERGRLRDIPSNIVVDGER
jgi:hypothetical protein